MDKYNGAINKVEKVMPTCAKLPEAIRKKAFMSPHHQTDRTQLLIHDELGGFAAHKKESRRAFG